jgi:outer membrane protein assembly factor BamB
MMVRLLGALLVGALVTIAGDRVLESSSRAANVSAVKANAAAAKVSWPQWRGPNRDGHSSEKNLLAEWKDGEPALLWKRSGMGRGFSSLSIGDGRIYTMGDRNKEQYVIAVALDGDKELWATKIGKGGEAGGYAGPRGTPTIDGDLIYAIGMRGDLACLKCATGEIVWQKNFEKDFGGRMMSGWGYAESPLVDGDRLICTPGGKDSAMVALDKKTGEVVWRAKFDGAGKKGNDGAGYASIVVSHAAGVKQYVQMVGHGLVSFAADDGRFLWNYDRIANGTANIPTPIVDGDFVFGSTGYGAGSGLVKISKDADDVKAEEVYFLEAKQLQNHHGGLILIDGYVYGGQGHGQGFPICVDVKTGKTAWSPGRGAGSGSAAVAYADGHLYFRYENGVVALIEANPKEYKLQGKFKIPDVKDPSWSHPVIAGGKLYLREQDTLYCYDVSKK